MGVFVGLGVPVGPGVFAGFGVLVFTGTAGVFVCPMFGVPVGGGRGVELAGTGVEVGRSVGARGVEEDNSVALGVQAAVLAGGRSVRVGVKVKEGMDCLARVAVAGTRSENKEKVVEAGTAVGKALKVTSGTTVAVSAPVTGR